MKRAFTLLGACLSAALLTACGDSKSLPVGPSSGLTSSTDVPPQGGQRSASTHVSKNGVMEKVLHSFEGGATDGSTPISRLLQVGNLLYGTSGGGGTYNKGTIFSISPAGTGFSVLYSFQGPERHALRHGGSGRRTWEWNGLLGDAFRLVRDAV
jgi:uncharacterized repeat protein (TIGR03803 family)